MRRTARTCRKVRPTCSPDLLINVAKKDRYNGATSIAASEEDESLWPAASAAAYPPAHSAQETPAAAAAAPCSRSCTPDSRDGCRDMADHDMPPKLVEDPAQLAHVPAPPS